MTTTPTLPKFQTTRVITALMIREMTTRYGRRFGGYFWAVAEPVGMIFMLSLAFGAFMRSPALGTSFILFYASGYLPFNFYSTINGMTSQAVSKNKPMMMFPMVSPMDAILARALLQVLTMIVVTLVILAGISVFVTDPVQISLWEFMLACLAASILGFGGGTLNVVLYAFFPVYKTIWGIISRPLFLVSGILYTVEMIPEGMRGILLMNPLVHVTGMAHRAFFPVYDGYFVRIEYPIALGVGMFIVGGALLFRNRGHVIENS